MASFKSFSGADIIATFNGKVIGELQSITYNVDREPSHIYSTGGSVPIEPLEIRSAEELKRHFGSPYSGTITISDPVDLSPYWMDAFNKIKDTTTVIMSGEPMSFEQVEPKTNKQAVRRLRKGDL